MTKRIYTDQQVKKYHAQYIKEQNSLKKFAKTNELSYHALYKGIKRLNLEIIPQSSTRRKYPINENFFENIDNEVNAYFLGLLCADGCNRPSANRIEISLDIKDKDIVIAFSKYILFGNDATRYYTKHGGFGMHSVAQLTLINKKISESLCSLGCVSRKTMKLQFPTFLPSRLIHHFTRGYFDGDGCLAIYERITNKGRTKSGAGNLYRNAEFNIVGTNDFLKGLGTYLSKIDIPFRLTKRHKDRETPTRTLRIYGNKNIRRVTDWLYQDATIFFKRKYKKYGELCSITDRQLDTTCAI